MRLGDLLTLESKKPLNFERVFAAIDQAETNSPPSQVIFVASDSPEFAIENFNTKYPAYRIIPIVSDPWTTISNLSRSGTFIGTNSKISVWVAILKFHQDEKSRVFLPIGAANHLEKNLARFSKLDLFSLY